MLAAAVITVWSAVDYLVRALPALMREERCDVTRIFVTGGSGFRRRRAGSSRLVERGDEVVALARSDEAERALDRTRRLARSAADVLDEDAHGGRHGRLRAPLPRGRRSTRCARAIRRRCSTSTCGAPKRR